MTIKDVAEYSGVSITTVSRVLNNHPDVREQVRKKVLEAIEQLHYVPNTSARDLGKSQNDTIGVVVRGVQNPFLNSVVRAIETEANKSGYSLITLHIGSDDDELEKGASLVRSKRLRGLILLGGRFDYTPEEVEVLDVPFVCCTFTNSFGTLDKTKFSSVYIDDYAEAYKATKMLIDKGHRKIALLLGKLGDSSIGELRYRGYCDAQRDAGIEVDEGLIAESQDYEMSLAYTATRELLDRRDDFTALFTVADSMAMAALKALYDTGRCVPHGYSVIAIDGIEMTNYTIPTLTTLVQPQGELGREAARILIDVLSGKPHRHVEVKTTLREGETVGLPRK